MATAGLDPVIKLWDLRQAQAGPTASLTGHVSSLVSRPKAIHHPEFYHHGR